MTNDIEKIQTVDNAEHGLKLDSGILSYIRTGITNVKQALDALFSGKADTNHTHTKSQITDFAHTHNAQDVYWETSASPSGRYYLGTMMISLTNKDAEQDTAIAGKANASHTHTIADVTGLQTTLDGKALLNHTHTWGKIDGQVEMIHADGEYPINPLFTEHGKLVHAIVINETGSAKTLSQLLVSTAEDAPIHFNSNASIGIDDTAIVTIYFMDNSSTEHEHAYCFYVTLDGKFNTAS